MAEYRFLKKDDSERVVDHVTGDYSDDLAALDAAQSLCGEHDVEVLATRRVAFVKKGNASTTARDPVSG